jgi:hypothetical protein
MENWKIAKIANEHLETKAAREAYAQNFCPPKGKGRLPIVINYLEVIIYARNMNKGLTDSEIIDKFELSWDKHQKGE